MLISEAYFNVAAKFLGILLGGNVKLERLIPIGN